jgi:hypothetical protein
MNEIPALFGPTSSLVGVVCQPDGNEPNGGIGCLTFNAGVVPRIGPHRFNVKLSRRLAADGITSMRFDLGGLGDSRPPGGQKDFLQQAISDIRAAMDYLEQHHGIRQFVLIGNCSGAVQIYWTALADERVSAILMFDGFAYATRWSRLVRHIKRIHAGTLNGIAVAVPRGILHRLKLALPRFDSDDQSRGATVVSDGNPPRDEYCRGMQTLVDRGVSVFQIFSGGVIDYYSYSAQFRHQFGKERFFSKVRCDFLPQIDHTLLSIESQQLLIEIIRSWMCDLIRASDGNDIGPSSNRQP